MVTDPTRRVRQYEDESVLTLEAPRVLARLAVLPPSTTVPYLTLSLDWRPDGSDPGREPATAPRPSERRSGSPDDGLTRRPARQVFDREMASLLEAHGPRGATFDSLTADAERISHYLDNELDSAAQGVFIVTCSAAGVFEPLALGLPVPTRLTLAPTPALHGLAHLIDDHPTYAVLLADQLEATLSLVTQATEERSVWLESTAYPRKQKQGGLSQRRFQARADERVSAFARDVAAEVRTALDEADVDMLILAGDEVILSALNEVLHASVSERIIGRLRLDIETGEQDMIAAATPLAQQAERDREEAAVKALSDAIGAGALGVAGPADTLAALQAGQVDTLLMVDDFVGLGWADYERSYYDVGAVPSSHPLAGDNDAMTVIALEDELIRLALITRAKVQIVHSAVPVGDADEWDLPEPGSPQPRTPAAAWLDAVGGVGALLRFHQTD